MFHESFSLLLQIFSDAKLFKTKFEEAKKIVSEECDLYNGKGDEEHSNDEGGVEESDNESDASQDESACEDNNCEEVTKKISELEVTNGKD